MYTIDYIGFMNEEHIHEFITCIENSKNKITELTINISSTGGSLNAGVAVYNYLKGLSIPITTRNIGEISSAAILFYLAGNVRVSEDISSFMIHTIQISVNEAISYYKAKQLIDNLEFDIRKYAAIVNLETANLNGKYNVEDYLKSESIHFDKKSAFECGIVTEL